MRIIAILFSAIIEFFYTPFVRAHIRLIALRTPIFPGQRWFLPMLGEVKVTAISEASITYVILAEECFDYHVVPRSEFVKFARDPSEVSPAGKVVSFPKLVKKDE